jgi:hypothetical protein
MGVAAMVVLVPVVGALGFVGCLLPEVGRFEGALRFGGFVVELVDGVVALDVVLDGGLAAFDARVAVPGPRDVDVWLWDVDVWLTESVPVSVPAFAADAIVWAESGAAPTEAETFFGVLDPPHAASPIAAISAIASAQRVAATRARRGT